MAPVVAFIKAGFTFLATLGASGSALAAAAVVAGSVVVARAAMNLFEVEMPKIDTDRSRQATVRSTTEPYKIIYGQTLVSGPVAFVGTAGDDNKDLYYAVALAGHEVNDITDMHFDDVVIPDAEIGGGSSSGGNVTGSGIFGPKNSKTIVKINKHLGTDTQAADSDLVAAFTAWTSDHQGKGIAYVVTKWTLDEDSQETWDKYTPNNIKALVQGKKIYDPRLEYAAVSTYGQATTNASYIAYGDNPALCLVDYLINSDYGMGIAASKIDWDAVVTAADGCDVAVNIPNSATEKRFTCNGVVFGTDSHRTNIDKILSSMNGSLSYVNGKYVMRAGIYEAPAISLNEDDLISGLSIKTSLERSDRFNTIKGVFIDPSQNYKSTEFPEVQLADALSRDNNELLDKEIALNMTNSSYMAQRISNKLIQLSDQQKVVSFPANLSAMRVAVGDRVQVSIDELNWDNKVFQCLGWAFSEEGGINLTLREDSSTSYADPAANTYSTISATGDIDPGFRGVPGPSGLSATAGLKNVELDWVNPSNNKDFESIFVYASATSSFSAAVKIGETDGTQFVHDFANGQDAVSPGDTRYYWVRAIRYVGTSSEARSNLEPNADPNTTVFATVGRVEWSDVSGSTNAPEDNATAGATVGTDLYGADGTTVLTETDVKNSVLAQDILTVEVEAGDVLDLETGADVDIQNLGDVAIYVSDQNSILNSSITSVSNSLSALQDVVVDLTTGVGEVYVQATAPVAGVGGVSDPIPDFSRWYDSDDNNHPYYWDGSAWQDLEDPRIGQNESDITSLESSLTTTNSNVTTNATAISALDTTVTSQGASITSISSDVTALETTVNDSSTGVAANATGLSNLTTRVTTAEGTITSQSSDITALQSDLTAAEGDITTNASGITGLTTRVTTAEGNISTNATDITALETTVNDSSTGVAATASGLSTLTTRVDTTEDDIDTNSSAITTLNSSFTQDLEFRTKVKDETGDQLETEDDSDVDLNELTDYVSGQSAATQALDVRTTASEDSITTQASQITALQSTVNDPSTGVDATSTALSSLTTRVTTAEGSITSQAADITTLQTDVGDNSASITTQAESIDGVEANYTVKIDNNNRISGFGLLSTTAGAEPFSEFAVVADQFSIVDPSSTASDPIQPFTVTAEKIFLGTDVQVDGDLLTTGTTISDVALQVGSGSSFFKASSAGIQLGDETFASAPFRVTAAGALTATSATITGAITATSLTLSGISIPKSDLETSVQASLGVADSAIQPGDDITSGTAGPVTITATSLYQGTGNFNNADTGFYLDNNGQFSLQDKLSFDGTDLTVSGNVTAASFTLSSGATLTDSDGAIENSQQQMSDVTGTISSTQHNIPGFYRITTDDNEAPSNAEFNTEAGRLAKIGDVVITTDTSVTPNVTYSWKCTTAGVADPAAEAVWTEITEFISGDLVVDGSISAANIAAQTLTSESGVFGIISANDVSTGTLNADNVTISNLRADDISGDVTEVYPISSTPNATLDNDSSPDATILLGFSTPAPDFSISKRNRISLAVEFKATQSSGSGLSTGQLEYYIERESSGFEITEIGECTYEQTVVTNYVEVISFSGNVTHLMDSNGAIAPNESPTAAQIGNIISLYYVSGSNKTFVEVSYGTGTSPHLSTGDTIYYSPSRFTASGTYTKGIWSGEQTLLMTGSSSNYLTVPLISSFGNTTTARNYRVSAKLSAQIASTTITCPKIYGTVENIS